MSAITTVGHIMDRQIIAVRQEATVKEVYTLMRRHGIGEFPIVDGEYYLRGIVEEHRILELLYPDGKPSNNVEDLKAGALLASRIPISTVMNKQVRVTEPTSDIIRVGKIMVLEKIKSMPVVENDKLVGLLHQSRIFLTLMRTFLEGGSIPAQIPLTPEQKKAQVHFLNDYKGAERRQYQRKRIKLLIAYRISGLDEVSRKQKAYVASTVDMSLGGLLINTDRQLEQGDLLDLVFDITGRDKPLKRLGRVVRCSFDQSTGAFRVGVMFLAMTTQERSEISEYLSGM